MPSYDLRCTDCGCEFEVFRQRFLTEDEKVCPSCGGAAETLLTGFVSALPARDAATPTVRNFAGHGGGCSCCSGGGAGSRADWQTTG